MLVKINRYYKYPDIKYQTPSSNMIWNDIVFTEENVEECDYLVILDYPKADFSIKVNPNNILHICLEPANEVSKYRQYANKKIAINFSQIDAGRNSILSHGALPWHLNRDYDFLSSLKVSELMKEDKIVWITSNQRSSKGHNKRMDFLDKLRNLPFVSLYGRGINEIKDKFDVLKSSKYAIAYENFKNDYYWTEKISDCFLSWTMPIYYGCNNIDLYFPKKSYIQLDPNDKHIHLYLKEVVKSNQWEKHIDDIRTARQLVLEKYQLFPFIYNQIKSLESTKGAFSFTKKENISFKGEDFFYDNYPLNTCLGKKIATLKRKF